MVAKRSIRVIAFVGHVRAPDLGRSDLAAEARAAGRGRDHITNMLIRTEQTPNPATRKFLPGQAVMATGTRDFADADSAQASPLAKALFDSGLVEGVFYGRDFISVTAGPAYPGPISSRWSSKPCSIIS